MSQPTPYEFRDAEEIAVCLSKSKAALGKWFDRRIDTLDEIARSGVGGNTFRAFHNMPQQPSVVFRNWAATELQNQKTIDELTSIGSQPQYDEWAREFSSRFSRTWRKQMGTVIPYGPSRKLPNLLLKCFVLWRRLSQIQRSNLLNYLHVPLDSFTLVSMRNCISDPEIPKTATMKFVGGETMYNHIQQAIRDITQSAKVPAIFFDVLAWDMSHRVL